MANNKNGIKNNKDKMNESNARYEPILANIDDIPQMNKICEEFWGENGSYPEDLFITALKQNLSYVYKEKNIIIAFCIAEYDKAEEKICISYLCVKPEYQKKGYGKSLLTFCIKNCINKGYTKFYLYVAVTNENAIKLYEKLGFYKDRFVKNYYPYDLPPNDDAFLMKLFITDKNYEKLMK